MLHQQRTPVPDFITGFQILADLAPLYLPRERLTVSEWAKKKIPHYDDTLLPFLPEIMDALCDPETVEVGDMGPAQGGKSMVGEAWMGWTIDGAMDPFLMVQPDKAAAEKFVKTRLDPLVKSVPALKQALLPGTSADNMHLKLFKGMYVGAAWPVKSQLRQTPYCNVWADDAAAMPDDIEGEGNIVGLMEGRQTMFEGRETMLVSSTPVSDEDWFFDFIAGGTDERLHPVCPGCGDRWEIDILRDMKFSGVTPDEAAESVVVVCRANGCCLAADDRNKLLRSLRDLPNRGFVSANLDVSKYRRTFRRDGLLARTSWTKLARQRRTAEIAWESRQDEGLLQTFYNTKGGKPYRSRLSGEKPVEANVLLERREKGWKLGTVPRGPNVLNLVVDVQADRFELSVLGTAAGRETWLVDRFAIHALDDGLTGVQPFVHKEHWKVLLPLFDRKYPMVDLGVTVGHAPILSVTVDTGGSDRKGDQATEGAKFFWNAARALGVHPNRITLVKGSSRPTGKLMPPAQFADQKVKGGPKRSSARLWLPNVHMIKNMIDARLRMTAPGPGYLHLPEDLSDEHVMEITAEELVKGRWEKKRTRNETWDHLVYGEAALLKPPFAQSRTDMRWIPRGFGIQWPNRGDYAEQAKMAQAARSEQIDVPDRKAGEETRSATPARPPRRRMVAGGGSGWLTKRRK